MTLRVRVCVCVKGNENEGVRARTRGGENAFEEGLRQDNQKYYVKPEVSRVCAKHSQQLFAEEAFILKTASGSSVVNVKLGGLGFVKQSFPISPVTQFCDQQRKCTYTASQEQHQRQLVSSPSFL